MKDLKHYFTDAVKASNGNREVTNESSNGIETSEEQAKESSPSTSVNTRKKRGRVKIKISQNNSRGSICDIIESKSDLVDKTPSPFNALVKVDETADNETPKRSNSLPRKSTKISHLKVTSKIDCEGKKPDENDNISKTKLKSDKPTDTVDRAIFTEHPTNTEISVTQREESNAFQVLMTRKKAIQYNTPVALSQQDEEAAAKAAEENKMKLKQNKEKLIALADKKGYSKRKIEELEEAEKIEKRLEKRAKVFKQMGKKDGDDKNLGRRVSPGSLHNYFSKTTPEQKELTGVSTLAIQTEIDATDSAKLAIISENVEMQILEENEEIFELPTTMDKACNINPEKILIPDALNVQTQTNQHKKKPKWSLRINLAGDGKKIVADKPDVTEDKISRKRESRQRRSKTKLLNYEENEMSDTEASSGKNSAKKKKSVGTEPKNKSTTKIDEISVIESNILPVEKEQTSTIPDIDIIEVKVDTNRGIEKLAPLFMKRQKPDPAVLEARRLFLHSVPAINENTKTDRKAPILGPSYLPFPVISHVAQLEDQSKIVNIELKTKFLERDKSAFVPSIDLDQLKSVTSLKNNCVKNVNDIEMPKDNVDELLDEITSRCEDAREMWKRISAASNPEETTQVPTKRRAKKRKSNDKKVEIVNNKSNEGFTWTQKYKPLNTREIVGNEEAADKLRKWLDGWKAPLRKDDYSSGDEFYSSDCSYASTFDNNKVAVLLGPHGSGKTASVYAVAEELGYSILEINASSKRTGKKILKELEEATKSHRIKKPDAMSMIREKKNLPQNSLILVEDVDLIFDEDEGFISATCQLASNTKRPIVFTGRDTCSHLSRMAPQQHRIYYQTSVGTRVSALLELITLAESGYRLPQSCLDLLLRNGDLRKALLQLQYLLLSGKPRASELPTNFQKSLWQDMLLCIYKPAIKSSKKSAKKKSIDSEKTLRNDETLMSLAKDLERLSFVTTLIAIEDPALEISTAKVEQSISLDESMNTYSSADNTSVEIARWLRDRLMAGKMTGETNDNNVQTLRRLSAKKELHLGVNFAFSQVSPQTLDNRAMATDYLPSLRAFCRAEETRVTNNSKRGNRFYHYLQTLRLPTTSTRPNILAAACKMLRDKSVSKS